jgi:hypothetical protein
MIGSVPRQPVIVSFIAVGILAAALEARRLEAIGRVDLVLHPFDDAAPAAVRQIGGLDEELAKPETQPS